MNLSYRVLASALLTVALGACSRNSMPTSPRTSGATSSASASLERVAAKTDVDTPESKSQAQVFTAAGDITPTVNAFRAALGNLNANVPGSLGSGRREINWDAVPAAFTNTNNFPADFFNQPVVGRARGTEFATPGTGFRTSDNNFADVAPDFDGPFVFFSPIRTFAAVGSSRMTVKFFVPGSHVGAASTGFGVVFSDVDRLGSASIHLFDSAGRSLGRFVAPTAPGGVSFIGVSFPASVVARVEIQSGQGEVVPVGIGGGDDERGELSISGGNDHDRLHGPDLVIMDDFIYGEPIAAAADSAASIAVAVVGSRVSSR